VRVYVCVLTVFIFLMWVLPFDGEIKMCKTRHGYAFIMDVPAEQNHVSYRFLQSFHELIEQIIHSSLQTSNGQ